MANFSLTERDRELLDFLREQGFAAFNQIERRFFPSRFACSRRLSKLAHAGYLDRLELADVFPPRDTGLPRKFFPYLLGLGLKPGQALFRLSDVYLKQIEHSRKLLKPDLCLHQLLLNDVRERLEKELSVPFVLNDPKLTILSDIHFDRRKEFTPDLSFECADYRLAVELERTQKSLNRYSMRFWFYTDSAYTHILYVYVNERHLQRLLQTAGSDRQFAFAHYLKPTEVLSNTWGYLTLDDFIARVNCVRRRT